MNQYILCIILTALNFVIFITGFILFKKLSREKRAAIYLLIIFDVIFLIYLTAYVDLSVPMPNEGPIFAVIATFIITTLMLLAFGAHYSENGESTAQRFLPDISLIFAIFEGLAVLATIEVYGEVLGVWPFT